MKKVSLSLIGAGQRGKDIYGGYIEKNRDRGEFVAVVEPDRIKREEFGKIHKIKKENMFENWDDFFAKGRLSDGLIIGTPDDLHFEPTMKAMDLGYDILLEKPMSNKPEEAVEIVRKAEETSSFIMVCHVLRYTGFYSKLKELVDEKIIGDILSIQHNENIGYYHFGHSFVRGNWRNSDKSSPLILQKSCHDMDILLWLIGSSCKKVSSFGHLSHFTKENKPENSASRCLDCSLKKTCIYSAPNLYLNNIGNWPTTAITPFQTEEGVRKALEEGQYGRCVYDMDNNVVDHQVSIMEFENNVTVDFSLSAFTDKVYRNINIMGTKGQIIGSDLKNKIKVEIFGSNEVKIIKPTSLKGGHGGGDTGIMNDFLENIRSNKKEALTDSKKSLESHMMAFAIEEARVKNKLIHMKDFYRGIEKDI